MTLDKALDNAVKSVNELMEQIHAVTKELHRIPNQIEALERDKETKRLKLEAQEAELMARIEAASKKAGEMETAASLKLHNANATKEQVDMMLANSNRLMQDLKAKESQLAAREREVSAKEQILAEKLAKLESMKAAL